ncbi:SGNH/GDSL hydrolase family protein [Intrasporangium sp. DVR]|uniref:SGNH/GDSL hydrolase family protein n=1 Tax=Intrasporangium sp. DVR TaxID=3127867 RepID=UPI00313A4EBC
MRRSRATDVSLGLIALLVNVAIVVAVVFFVGGRSEAPPEKSAAPSSASTSTTSGTAGSAAPTDISQVLTSDKDVVLAVLGDGTGDEDGEWVSVLAELLGQSREVSLRNLDPTDPTRYAKERTYGESGPTAVMWNGSRLGANASYAAERLDFLVPEEPDAILLNYGRDDKASAIAARLDTTLAAIKAKWPKTPVAVVLQAQNTDDQLAPVREATAEWAEVNKLTEIDVAGAFLRAGDPNSFVSIVDPPSVNSLGGRLWGETVFTALGGKLVEAPSGTASSEPTLGVETPGVAVPGAISLPQGGAPPSSPTSSPTAVSTNPPPPDATVTDPPQETSPATFTATRMTRDPDPTTTTIAEAGLSAGAR